MRKFQNLIATLLITMLLTVGCGQIDSTPNKDNQKSQKQETYVSKVDADHGYNDGEHVIKFVGLKEYSELKTDMYTDKPQKGKIFLVLFLECTNNTDSDLYINEANLESEVDGQKNDHTILLNDPEGYPTLFRTLGAHTTDLGFMVWEVPENWKSLTLQYSGFEGSNHNLLKMQLSKEDLKDPQEYSKAVPH